MIDKTNQGKVLKEIKLCQGQFFKTGMKMTLYEGQLVDKSLRETTYVIWTTQYFFLHILYCIECGVLSDSECECKRFSLKFSLKVCINYFVSFIFSEVATGKEVF